MYYDELIERKIPALFIIMNSKCENAYNEIFQNIKNMINFKENENYINEKNSFITITTDNELALINSLQLHFPQSQRISCYYHFKNNLQKRARELGLKKKELLEDTKKVINELGLLPLIYKGNLDTISEFLDKLKYKFPKHSNFINDFYKDNERYFISQALNYNNYPFLVRSNSILENYNRIIKKELGKKKEINYLNFVSFIKKEDKRFYNEIYNKSRDYNEILKSHNKFRNKYKSDNFFKDKNIDNTNLKGIWLKNINNSCRYDVLMTIYLFIFKKIIEQKQNVNEYFKTHPIIHKLDEVVYSLSIDINSESRYDFWSLIDTLNIDNDFNNNTFGQMGYISGIFSIFNEDKDFCIEIREDSFCYLCQKKFSKLFFSKFLIPIHINDIKASNIKSLLILKFLPSIRTCNCINDPEYLCKNSNFEIVNISRLLCLILDISFKEYNIMKNWLIEIFSNKIEIDNYYYNLKGIICNHNNLHYSCYILNNDINILNLSLNSNLMHDGLQNDGKIIEINDSIENIIKNNFCYIFLISRVKNK